MSSQEDYLDQLLRNIMNGGKAQPQSETAEPVQAAEEINVAETAGEAQWAADMEQAVPEISEMAVEPETADLSAYMEEVQGMPGETPGVEEMPGEMSGAEMFEEPGMADLSAIMEEIQGMPGETPGVEEIPGEMSGAEMFEEPGMADLSAIMEEIQGMPGETPGVEEMSGEMSGAEMFEEPGTADLSAIMEEIQGMPGETPGAEEMSGEMSGAEMFEEPETADLSAIMEEIQGMPESGENISGESVDDADIDDLFKTFEDSLDIPAENDEAAANLPEELPSGLSDAIFEEEAVDSPTTADLSSMSEDDVERLLAESRGTSEDSPGSSEEEFQGDVVDLLKGTEDGELQEIQDLLEKSDNNEAVDDEIEAILRGAVQESYQNSTGSHRTGTDADHEDEAEEQLSPRQKKAMEKKRLKEEKAAARKAAKEARKAEKAAKKAARKSGEDADNVEAADGAAAGAEGSLDTAFLDSILSEAGKIDGAETISSATGNYDVKVDNIIPDEEEDISVAQKGAAGAVSSVSADLGVDMDNLFAGSAEAESSLMAGGDSNLADFVALDGSDVNGIIQLGEEDEEDAKPKKKGFFSRFLEFLTEEDEEEEEENENIKLSEENQEIIEDLDKEKGKKDKKGKKGKKKAKKADASAEGGEEGEEGEEAEKGKKKKAKKPKKEKLPKEEEEPVDPGKRLGLKKVLPIALICLSLGTAIIILTYASVSFGDRKTARNAYYEGDYKTCYQNLYGKDMNESEQVMFEKSECILRIRMWISEYEMLTAEGARLEALDSLIQSVNDYPALYDYAGQCNAAGEVAQEYATILNLLYENYGLTEEQARAIAAEPDDIEYTRQVNAIVQGGAYGSWNEPEPEVDVPLQDELPEETELPEGNFIDTNTSVQ